MIKRENIKILNNATNNNIMLVNLKIKKSRNFIRLFMKWQFWNVSPVLDSFLDIENGGTKTYKVS